MSASEKTMQSLWESGYLSAGNAAYVEALYVAYLEDRNSVEAKWQACFDALPKRNGGAVNISNAPLGVAELVRAYRLYGHFEANLDPLGIQKITPCLKLKPESYGISAQDAQETVQKMRKIYCETLGVEYYHLQDDTAREWLCSRIESSDFLKPFSKEQKLDLLKSLTKAEGLEKYLGSKYVGQKRFSLEGGDAMLPMLEALVARASDVDVKEVIIGMAHRGRLNVLVNLIGKAPKELFGEFEGRYVEGYTGDVKYHIGHAGNIKMPSGKIIQVAMGFNPSHLEIVAPVIEGSVRARQQRRKDKTKDQVLAVALHGDAAFAGQGVVMEMLNASQTRGFTTGGTVRIIVNNQIGFTTSEAIDARSSHYCTDIAKMIDIPVFHVNGDDPEMVVRAIELAFDYRMRFKKDVLIDFVCYRRHGHNEADEPAMTQPMMYDIIRKKQTVRQTYAEQLVNEKVLTSEDVSAMTLAYRDLLDKEESPVNLFKEDYEGKRKVNWKAYTNTAWNEKADTKVNAKDLDNLTQNWLSLPQEFAVHPTIQKTFVEYEKMRKGEVPIVWGYAENLAYASLLAQGYSVRLTGEDVGRGTFTHRHAVLHDFKNGNVCIPLEQFQKDNTFDIYNSLLSEEAVLGFEYGYATSEPETLVLWEAQFGDFANGAQVVIDQFLSAGEQKWGQLAGLVLLLPHGQEGQGPEHSSARLERFLQLCAQDNMQVCVPSVPSQIFHLLRRQMLRPFRKPLIVMTPKSLLRHRLATSSLKDLTEGEFQLVMPEVENFAHDSVTKVILCAGKVYFDLLQQRQELQRENIAILRIEQLYPFPSDALKEALKPYKNAKSIVWCQEEPKNQGAWLCIKDWLSDAISEDKKLTYVGLEPMAAPAVGSAKLCKLKQQAFILEALS